MSSGPGFGLSLHRELLQVPLTWRAPRFVFVNSMSDLFHPRVPAEFIVQVFKIMGSAPQHTFQVLTKRPARVAALLTELCPKPLSNVWLGTSVESAKYLYRSDDVRSTPAAVRFLSLEPLLGPIPSLNLDQIDWVIVGGESGPQHRPPELDWIRSIRDSCVEQDVAFFFKQWGRENP